jgi:hypothetical protein
LHPTTRTRTCTHDDDVDFSTAHCQHSTLTQQEKRTIPNDGSSAPKSSASKIERSRTAVPSVTCVRRCVCPPEQRCLTTPRHHINAATLIGLHGVTSSDTFTQLFKHSNHVNRTPRHVFQASHSRQERQPSASFLQLDSSRPPPTRPPRPPAVRLSWQCPLTVVWKTNACLLQLVLSTCWANTYSSSVPQSRTRVMPMLDSTAHDALVKGLVWRAQQMLRVRCANGWVGQEFYQKLQCFVQVCSPKWRCSLLICSWLTRAPTLYAPWS